MFADILKLNSDIILCTCHASLFSEGRKRKEQHPQFLEEIEKNIEAFCRISAETNNDAQAGRKRNIAK
jgi:hypothetical protein